MTSSIDFLEKAKTKLGIESDYALAKALGLTTGGIAHYKCGRRIIDDYTAAKIAEILEISPLEVIAVANMEREKEPGKKDFWRRIAEGGIAAMLLFSLSFHGIEKAEANTSIIAKVPIMRNWIRRFLGRFLVRKILQKNQISPTKKI